MNDDLISRSALLGDLKEKHFLPVIVSRAIERAPAVDAANVYQVVRCEKCKHWNVSPGTGGNWGECEKIGDRDREGGASLDLDTYHDDYCSSGEKKEAPNE